MATTARTRVAVLAAAVAVACATTLQLGALPAALARGDAGVVCPVNASGPYPPLTCPSGAECCKGNIWGPYKCREDSGCNVCAECCHDALKDNQTLCDACVHASCAPGSFGDWGCKDPSRESGSSCCTRGLPLAASSALPNCLLVGDSVTNGLFPKASEYLKDVCQVQHIESVDAFNEQRCFWATETSGTDGEPIPWDVIQFNEGLHSLWPRVNTSAEMAVWAQQLGNFTKVLQATGATLIYATMTPYMPEKYLNPPGEAQNDVETKNALAVKTVQTLGVTRINDLYTTVTNVCGKVYRNCSICDDESAYHPQGKCGFHYVEAGWELLGNATAQHVAAALKARATAAPSPSPSSSLSSLSSSSLYEVKAADGSATVTVDATTGTIVSVGAGWRLFGVDAGTAITGDGASTDPTPVSVTPVHTAAGQGVRIVRSVNAGVSGAATVSVTETIAPAATSVAWNVSVEAIGGDAAGVGATPAAGLANWTAPIETAWTMTDANATTSFQMWAPWDRGSYKQSPPTVDPLKPSDGHYGIWNGTYHYGSAYGGGAPDMIVAPQMTVLDPSTDHAVSLVLSPRDPYLELWLRTVQGAQPGFAFSREQFRMSPAASHTFEMHVVGHAACWRPALAWSVQQYPEFWTPTSTAAAARVDGLGSYSWALDDLSDPSYAAMDYRVNWDLSGRFFPWMSMFLPPVQPGETWRNDLEGTQAPANVTFGDIDAYYARTQARGFSTLSYYNVFEAGFHVDCSQGAASADNWRNASQWLHYHVWDAMLNHSWAPYAQAPMVGCRPTWQQATVFDPAVPSFNAHLVTQMQRHVQQLQHFQGVVVDRSDWNAYYNLDGDDGIAWVLGQRARSMKTSFLEVIGQMRQIMDGDAATAAAGATDVASADAVADGTDAGGAGTHSMLINTLGYCALSLMRDFDGSFSEGHGIAAAGLLGVRSPAIMWTYDAKECCASPQEFDAYMQWRLYLGVYPMAPFPDADHSVDNSNATVVQLYSRYGPLFRALQGAQWVLEARPVSVTPTAFVSRGSGAGTADAQTEFTPVNNDKTVLVNAFAYPALPSQRVFPVVLGTAAGVTEVTLHVRGLPAAPSGSVSGHGGSASRAVAKSLTVDALYPGSKGGAWTPLQGASVSWAGVGEANVTVPLGDNGGLLVRLTASSS